MEKEPKRKLRRRRCRRVLVAGLLLVPSMYAPLSSSFGPTRSLSLAPPPRHANSRHSILACLACRHSRERLGNAPACERRREERESCDGRRLPPAGSCCPFDSSSSAAARSIFDQGLRYSAKHTGSDSGAPVTSRGKVRRHSHNRRRVNDNKAVSALNDKELTSSPKLQTRPNICFSKGGESMGK